MFWFESQLAISALLDLKSVRDTRELSIAPTVQVPSPERGFGEQTLFCRGEKRIELLVGCVCAKSLSANKLPFLNSSQEAERTR